MKDQIIMGSIILLLISLVSGCGNDSASASSSKWYEGGTLHKANALQWQQAKQSNKLATSADFVGALSEKGALKTNIQNKMKAMSDFKPLAKNLVSCIDKASEKDPSPEKNKRMYANQSVSSLAVSCAVLMGWVN